MEKGNKKDTAKKQNQTAIIVGIIIICIIVGFVIMKEKDKPAPKEKKNEIETEISYEQGGELSEEEIEQEAERIFEEDYLSTENFLGMYGLRKTGKDLLFTNTDGKIDFSLIIYNSEEDRDERFKESNEKIKVDGKEYKLYSTGIDYEEYKSELLNYMSENVFNKYFTQYTKNIDGKLYITNEVEDFYTLESLENTDEGKYLLSYKTEGETKEAEISIDTKTRIVSDINL